MVVVGLLTVGLVAALAGDAYLWVRSTHLNEQIAQNQADEHTQISTLKEATTTLLQQEQQRLEEVAHQVKGVNDSATTPVRPQDAHWPRALVRSTPKIDASGPAATLPSRKASLDMVILNLHWVRTARS